MRQNMLQRVSRQKPKVPGQFSVTFEAQYIRYWSRERVKRKAASGCPSIGGCTPDGGGILALIPFCGAQFNRETNWVARYQEQVAEHLLPKGEARKMTLQDLFGWAADRISSMEGWTAHPARFPRSQNPAGNPLLFGAKPPW